MIEFKKQLVDFLALINTQYPSWDFNYLPGLEETIIREELSKFHLNASSDLIELYSYVNGIAPSNFFYYRQAEIFLNGYFPEFHISLKEYAQYIKRRKFERPYFPIFWHKNFFYTLLDIGDDKLGGGIFIYSSKAPGCSPPIMMFENFSQLLKFYTEIHKRNYVFTYDQRGKVWVNISLLKEIGKSMTPDRCDFFWK